MSALCSQSDYSRLMNSAVSNHTFTFTGFRFAFFHCIVITLIPFMPFMFINVAFTNSCRCRL